MFPRAYLVQLAKYSSERKMFRKKFVEKNEVHICVPNIIFSISVTVLELIELLLLLFFCVRFQVLHFAVLFNS
jgi:hypothetical protein